MGKHLKFDFYRVVYEGDFGQHLKGVFDMDPEAKTFPIRDVPVRLQEHELKAGLVCGDFIRIRMENLPVKASVRSADLQAMAFRDDEGVGESAAFAFAPDLRVIAFQKSQYSPTIGQFAAYLSRFAGSPTAVDFLPVIQETALRRLQEMEVVRTFDIEVAPASGELWRGADASMKDMAKVSAASGAPLVHIQLKMGHDRGSLDVGWVKRMAKWASGHVREENREVTRIRVSGKVGSNDETTLVDLVTDRMSDFVDLGRVEVRRLRYVDRAGAAREAMRHKRDELERLHTEED